MQVTTNFALYMKKLTEYICFCALPEQNGVKGTGCAAAATIIIMHLVHTATGMMFWFFFFSTSAQALVYLCQHKSDSAELSIDYLSSLLWNAFLPSGEGR
jgi:hypothetical protein